MGVYRRLQNGRLPDRSPQELYQVSALILILGQQGHCDTLSQSGLATADRVKFEEVQYQMGGAVGHPECSVSPRALKIEAYETIHYSSR